MGTRKSSGNRGKRGGISMVARFELAWIVVIAVGTSFAAAFGMNDAIGVHRRDSLLLLPSDVVNDTERNRSTESVGLVLDYHQFPLSDSKNDYNSSTNISNSLLLLPSDVVNDIVSDRILLSKRFDVAERNRSTDSVGLVLDYHQFRLSDGNGYYNSSTNTGGYSEQQQKAEKEKKVDAAAAEAAHGDGNTNKISKWIVDEIGNRIENSKWTVDGIGNIIENGKWIVDEIRVYAAVPVLRASVVVCLVMSAMLVVELGFLASVSLFVRLVRRRPAERRYKWEPIDVNVSFNGQDLEAATLTSQAFPMVLLQIPMYNEKEVYKLSIAAACALTWPSDRIIIQVLDDSTDPTVTELVELECKEWERRGMNIKYEVRGNRKGYKAGALKEGMNYSYVQQCEFVAIFDSDFQPQSDFLMRTIPFLTSNLDVALVQARWEFVNSHECILTRLQRMTLDYHFKVEQEAGSSTFGFFGFNGTAGVWRISALNDAGGWNDRTTVEDMDLAVRATLRGWKFIYAGNIKVRSELPSNFKAYRLQQHRWTCGAANLFRKMTGEIIMTKNVPFFKKVYVIYSFFFVRKVVAHVLTFTFYSLVIPLTVFFPEVQIPLWGIFYIPTAISVLHAIRNPSSLHLLVFWIVFENVMSLHRMKATISGLFEAGKVNEWVVTKKLGEALLANPEEKVEKSQIRFTERLYLFEMGCGIFLLICACYNLMYETNYYYVYIYLQAVAFIIIGFGCIGTNSST